MLTVSLKGFLKLVDQLKEKKEYLEQVYSAWSTGQPVELPYDVMVKYMINYDRIANTIKKFLKDFKKGKLEKFYFIIGEFGSGKTQLMYLLKEELRSFFNTDTFYVSLEDFVNSGEKEVLFFIKDKLNAIKRPVVIMFDDIDFFFSKKSEDVGLAIYEFLKMISNALSEKWGGKIRTILLAISDEYFKELQRYLSPISKHGFSWKVLIDLQLDFENFLELSLEVGFRLLAIQYLLEYYDGFREKIEESFGLIWEYLYNLTLRIAKFGIRTVGLYLKMVNDRLVDFIRFLDPNKKVSKENISILDYVNVIEKYLESSMNDIILSFDRYGGYERYKVVYKNIMEENMIGLMRVINFGEESSEKINGVIGLYYTCLLYTSPSPRDRG
mgnify:CR=1 FL=1